MTVGDAPSRPRPFEDLSFAISLADRADNLTLRYAQEFASLGVTTKEDGSPVTDADHAVERELRAMVRRVRPSDGFLGEESATTERSSISARRWIVDPIDGTLAFIRGEKAWCTQLALEADGELQVAVLSFPAMSLRYVATRSGGAYRNGRRIRVSSTTPLTTARWSTYVPDDSCLELAPVRRMDFAAGKRDELHGYAWLAEGTIDVAFDLTAGIWDFAPAKLLVEEAGGRMTDLDGGSRLDTGAMVATNGLLHSDALKVLAGPETSIDFSAMMP